MHNEQQLRNKMLCNAKSVDVDEWDKC